MLFRSYVKAAGLKRLFVPFDEHGHPLTARVARQIVTVEELLAAWNDAYPANTFAIEALPAYEDILSRGIGAFLKPPPAPGDASD